MVLKAFLVIPLTLTKQRTKLCKKIIKIHRKPHKFNTVVM